LFRRPPLGRIEIVPQKVRTSLSLVVYLSMNVVVTGGSGYLGTHIKNHFSAVDLSRHSGSDILVTEDAAAVADFDVVIHLAALLDRSAENADAVFRTNVEGTVNILKHVRPGAAFIFASAKDVYGRFADQHSLVPETCSTQYAGHSPLEWSKLIAERYVEYYAATRGFRSCLFRLSTVFAPPTPGNVPSFVGHFADLINKGEPIRLQGGGRPVRDILFVDDVSTACEAFADSVIRNGLYNLGGGPKNAFSLADLVKRMEAVSGLQAVISEVELPDPTPLNYVTDLSLISQELGWSPSTDIDEALSTLF
jgi:nucleoside-diphosphate-sugar epimerase